MYYIRVSPVNIFHVLQIDNEGTARKMYGPRPNQNKNNIGEIIEVSKEDVVEEEVEVNIKKKKKKKKKVRTS